jgi:hypothetical protein
VTARRRHWVVEDAGGNGLIHRSPGESFRRERTDRQFVGTMNACRSGFTGGAHMAELVRTNDFGVILAIEGLLGGADIPYQVTDRNMSVLEGSIIAIHEAEARELLVDAELGNWLRP